LLHGSPMPSRVLLRHARQFSPRLLTYNAWLFTHSAARRPGYALLQWLVRLFGPRSLRAVSLAWNRLRPL